MTIPAGRARRIRVLVVDDSPLAVEMVRRMLAGSPEIEVAGSAANGAQALELIPNLRPDVIVTDLHMPGMGGLELTQEVMQRHPLPVLVLSQSVQAGQTDNIFRMIEAGALDVVAKPRGGLDTDFDATARDLARKVRVAAGVVVIRRHARASDGNAAAAAREVPAAPLIIATAAPRIIGIGASTGGPQAFQSVLGALPADFALPLVCVQHIAEGFMQGLVDWLAKLCRIRVRTAVEGTAPLAGNAYFAPDCRHLAIDDAGRFQCPEAHPNVDHRPSVDLALGSLARCYGNGALGVLLTGMGGDGVQGLLAISRAGGLTIAQDEQSSIVYGMPKRAAEAGAARHVLPLDRIAPALIDIAAETAPDRDANGKPREGKSSWPR